MGSAMSPPCRALVIRSSFSSCLLSEVTRMLAMSAMLRKIGMRTYDSCHARHCPAITERNEPSIYVSMPRKGVRR
jgi:hypothetical protein